MAGGVQFEVSPQAVKTSAVSSSPTQGHGGWGGYGIGPD